VSCSHNLTVAYTTVLNRPKLLLTPDDRKDKTLIDILEMITSIDHKVDRALAGSYYPEHQLLLTHY
jgi:hypothetical protein